MRYLGPKARRCRRQGVNLWGSDKYDRILQRKPHGPGKSPKSRRSKLSEYGQQLLEKQKVRDMYGISEAQFRRYYREAARSPGQTGQRILEILERRLDNVVFRAGFAMTRLQARQFVSHGLLLKAGRRITVPSYQVREDDSFEVRPRSRTSPVFTAIRTAHEKYLTPPWIQADPALLRLVVVRGPQAADLEKAIDIQKIVEFYSR